MKTNRSKRKGLRMRFLSAAAAWILVISAASLGLAFPSRVFAEEMYSQDYYRAADASDGLSEAEQQSLDQDCLEFMESYHADLSLLAVPTERYEGMTLSDFARGYYEDCGFGYGPGKDGFQMIWDTDTDEVLIEAYGAAQDLIPQDYRDFVAGQVTKFREDYGIYGPMYASFRYLSNYMGGSGSSFGSANEAAESEDAESAAKDAEEAQTQDAGLKINDELQLLDVPVSDGHTSEGHHETLPEGEKPDPSLRFGEGADMPSWYPKETETFPYYHDAEAPRVVDRADIFTDEEETRMEERLWQLREQLSQDIVVFTDVSTYGLSHTAYADDYFDFNGYGVGEDFEGVCLMICMDPSNRGWWTSCSGPVTRGLYTEEIANQIDDLLYEYMKAGDYGEGVEDWIENFRRLYTTGSPYSEDWALLSKESFERFHDGDAPRVVDDAKILNAEEIEQLTAQAASLSEKYGLDVVIHTVRNEGILDREEYGDSFWYFNGYGYGDNYDGIQLTIFKRPNESGGVRVSGSGKGLAKLTDVNKKRLENRIGDVVLSRDYYEAGSQWLDQTGHMLRTGRAPRSAASWNFFTAIEMIIGLIFGGVSLGNAKKRMATPKIRENADAYIVPGSLHVKKLRDDLIDTTVSKQYSPRPKQTRSSGGSSGGRSSYSGSHTSSSGRTHSGSGRRF